MKTEQEIITEVNRCKESLEAVEKQMKTWEVGGTVITRALSTLPIKAKIETLEWVLSMEFYCDIKDSHGEYL